MRAALIERKVVWGIRGSEGSWWKTKNAEVFQCKIGQTGERVTPSFG